MDRTLLLLMLPLVFVMLFPGFIRDIVRQEIETVPADREDSGK